MDDEILDPLLLPSSPGSTVSQLTNDTGLLRPEDDICLGIQLPNEPPGYGSPIPISSLDELPHRLSMLGSEAEADTASTITAPMHMVGAGLQAEHLGPVWGQAGRCMPARVLCSWSPAADKCSLGHNVSVAAQADLAALVP